MIKVKTNKEFLEVVKNKLKDNEVILFDEVDDKTMGKSRYSLLLAKEIGRAFKEVSHTNSKRKVGKWEV